MFCEKGVPRNFAKFLGKHLCQCLFFNKVAGFSLFFLLKKRLWHWCFPVNFAKFRRTLFLPEHRRWLLLKSSINYLNFYGYFFQMFFENFLFLLWKHKISFSYLQNRFCKFFITQNVALIQFVSPLALFLIEITRGFNSLKLELRN